jgi:hypothetical protein
MVKRKIKTFVLVSEGFDETAVIECLCRARDYGMSANLVGLHAGLLSGHHGITLRPDLSLNQLEEYVRAHAPQTAVILNSDANLTPLLNDPRVHRIVEQTLRQQGLVAVMSAQDEWPLPADAHNATAERNLLLQGQMDTAEFIQEIMKRISI